MDRITHLEKGLSLRTKLVGLISLLVVLVIAAITIASIDRERRNFRQEWEGQADLLLETLSLTMRDQLYLLELDELLDTARVVSRNENVTLVRIYDNEGVILIDTTDDEEIQFSRTVDPVGADLIDSGPASLYIDWQPEQLVAGRSLELGGRTIGAVAIGLSDEPFEEKIAALTLQSTVIALVTLMAGVGLAFLLTKQIVTPLARLSTTASQLAAGNLDRRVTDLPGGEIGELAYAFNEMADAIQNRDAELRELNTNLEAQVKVRTVELESRNQELTKANKALVEARKEAEEASRLKSQFLASMSHELRTPLNAIMGFSQLLMAGTYGDITDKQETRLKRITDNAGTLLEMINDLLDLSKIEAGRTELVNKPFDLEDWLDDIHNQLSALADEKGIKFVSEMDEDLPETIIADPVRLKQVAINLLSNALKFTDEGIVKIAVTRHGDIWQMQVSDTGVGIPSHAQEYIFDEFRQVDGTSQRKHGGTGLGLAIVRNLVVMMGGTIRVNSTVGEGSTFTVRLPLRAEKAETSETA